MAHLTPGHTKGCTTWTHEGAGRRARRYNVVIVGSPNVNTGYKLVNNAAYPQIADDYARTFRVLKSLHCDIFLGAHGDYYGMERSSRGSRRAARMCSSIPKGIKAYIAGSGEGRTWRPPCQRSRRSDAQSACTRRRFSLIILSFHVLHHRQLLLVPILELYSRSLEWRWIRRSQVLQNQPTRKSGFFILRGGNNNDYLDAATCHARQEIDHVCERIREFGIRSTRSKARSAW